MQAVLHPRELEAPQAGPASFVVSVMNDNNSSNTLHITINTQITLRLLKYQASFENVGVMCAYVVVVVVSNNIAEFNLPIYGLCAYIGFIFMIMYVHVSVCELPLRV